MVAVDDAKDPDVDVIGGVVCEKLHEFPFLQSPCKKNGQIRDPASKVVEVVVAVVIPVAV